MSDWLRSILEQFYSAPGYLFAGIGLIFFSAWLGRQAGDRWDQWIAAGQPINANNSHEIYDPPMLQFFQGVTGCIGAIILRFLQLMCLLIGLDFVLLQGHTTDWLMSFLG